MTKTRNLLGILAISTGLLGLASTPATAVPPKVIYICKIAEPGSGVTGTYSFLVSQGPYIVNQEVKVPVGGCSDPVGIAVAPQPITIVERPVAGIVVVDITVASGVPLKSDPANGTVVVSESSGVYAPPPPPYTPKLPFSAGTITFTNQKAVASCVAPPPGMSAWYPFDESSGTTARNLRPPSPFATLVNGPLHVSGKVANALQFDGIDDYAQSSTPDPNLLIVGSEYTVNFSIDFWIKTNSTLGTQAILDKRTGTHGDNSLRGYAVAIQDGKMLLQMANGVGFTNFVSAATFVADGTWHHIAITAQRWSSTGLRFYKDGVLQSVANPTGRTGGLANTAPLTFAKDTLGIVAHFKGMLDEVEIFQWAIHPWFIERIFAAGPGGKCK